MSEKRKSFRRFQNKSFRRPKPQTTEEKIKSFIIRNSKNGYFTRVTTLAYKFEIPHQEAWDVVGALLADNVIESYHDASGEMKLCESGYSYKILKNSDKHRNKKRKSN